MRTMRALLALLALAIPATLLGQAKPSISIGPPPLPQYEQPLCPGDGYLWTPGYWAYDESVSGYYWVDGEWIVAPEEGFLWTPGYWALESGEYRFSEGYWGPQVGFYGGINYGFGYSGDGYAGGRWNDGQFFYNRSENNVDVTRNRNVYDTHFKNQNPSRVSFNGTNGGIEARPTSEQEAAGKQRHIAPTAVQIENAQTSRISPTFRSSSNRGNASRPEEAQPIEALKPDGARPTTVEPRVEQLKTKPENDQPHSFTHPDNLAPIVRPKPTDSGK